MEKEFIPYAEALALKELGFDKASFGVYYISDPYKEVVMNGPYVYGKNSGIYKKYNVLAPTFSQAFRWFREKYGLVSTVLPYQELRKFSWNYNYNIVEYAKDTIYGHLRELTYEEAEIECLKKLIEIVKQ